MAERKGAVARETGETTVRVELNVDGTGVCEVSTGVKMLDHLLEQVARHGLFDIKISASGEDQHHMVEDVAICVGQALHRALGGKEGLVRMGDSLVPMDEALSQVAVDISGRAWTVVDVRLSRVDVGDLEADMVRHFLVSLASEARLALHARIIYGTNDHHMAESLFKALGRALDAATRIDERRAGGVPSTKGKIGE
ncbi:MAG: imidazoleglycerol-phosphate dehydratase HisB [Chloroflexota bacterium]